MTTSSTKLTVAYPGPDGTHSAAATAKLFPDGELIPLPTFQAVVAATRSAEVDRGVLPIESSLAGPVPESHDLLHDAYLSIADETVIHVKHQLLGLEQIPLEDIRTIRSNPNALDQCRNLIASLPWAIAVVSSTTSGAAAEVAAGGDPSVVAIASDRAGELYGLQVVADNVGDHPEAYTRFVSLARFTRLDGDRHHWRTAFWFVTDHRPGALHRAIEPFSRHAIDLVQLVSRPLPEHAFRCRFDAVLHGHPLDPVVAETLAEVRRQTRRMHVFGSYPVGS